MLINTTPTHKMQNVAEAGGGVIIAITSYMADVTVLVQQIGVWAGALLALVGLYGAIKREIFGQGKKKKDK